MNVKRGRQHPGPPKTKPWDSGWIELKGTISWTHQAQQIFRVDALEVSAGRVREVRIGNLRVTPNNLPYPSIEPGMYMVVVGQVGTRFRMTGVQVQ
jgi:hypothetical protein